MIQPKNKIKAFKTLQSFIDYYMAETDRRCRDSIGQCQYVPPPNLVKVTNGCAIGRYLTTEVAEFLDTIGAIASIYEQNFEGKLPKWMQNMGKDYLRELQSLHDFMRDDLNETKNEVMVFCKDFELDYTKLKFPEKTWLK